MGLETDGLKWIERGERLQIQEIIEEEEGMNVRDNFGRNR